MITSSPLINVYVPLDNIPAVIDFEPNTLDLESNIRWITVCIKLLTDY
ncbi:MAG: hypothetical protein QXU09_00540 [Thermoproteota archaeon]|nr:hypothetical protein [Candidatus Brockarchaeota archaeon]